MEFQPPFHWRLLPFACILNYKVQNSTPIISFSIFIFRDYQKQKEEPNKKVIIKTKTGVKLKLKKKTTQKKLIAIKINSKEKKKEESEIEWDKIVNCEESNKQKWNLRRIDLKLLKSVE